MLTLAAFIVAIAALLFFLRVFVNLSRNIETAGFSTSAEKALCAVVVVAMVCAGYAIVAIAETMF